MTRRDGVAERLPQGLTTKQAARALQVHPITIQRWMRDGTLRGIKLPGRAGYRIPESEITRLLTPEAMVLPSERTHAAMNQLLDQAERARARGDDEAAARFEAIAGGMVGQ